jgi:Ni/Co efflux regulator RcnB
MMKKLAIVFALGAAALMGSSAANAADSSAKVPAAAKQVPTDISSQHRHRHWRGHHHHHRHWGHHHHRHWGHHHYRPYYNSYGYAPRSYGYYGGPRYYGGGPGVTFSFGGGRW